METHQTTFCAEFRFILEHWSMYKHSFRNSVEQFIDLCYFKVFKVNNSPEIYPELFEIVRTAQLIMNYIGNDLRVQTEAKRENLDFYFQHFVNELETRNSRNGRYCIVS